jgi:hypothetical protein
VGLANLTKCMLSKGATASAHIAKQRVSDPSYRSTRGLLAKIGAGSQSVVLEKENYAGSENHSLPTLNKE